MSRRAKHRAMRYRSYVRYGNRNAQASHPTLKSLALLVLLAIATPLAVFSGNDDASSARTIVPTPHHAAPSAPLVGPEPPPADVPAAIAADAATSLDGAEGEVASIATEAAPPIDDGASRIATAPPAPARAAKTTAVSPARVRVARRSGTTATSSRSTAQQRATTPTKWEVRVDDNARPGDSRPDASWRKSPVPGLDGAAVRRGIG